MPELGPEQQFEVDASLVDPDGLVARATGATQRLEADVRPRHRGGGGLAARAGGRERGARRPAGRRLELDLVAHRHPPPPPRGRAKAWSTSQPARARRPSRWPASMPGDLDLVLVATFTPDQLLPNAAPQVASRLGAALGGSDRHRRRVHGLPLGPLPGDGAARVRAGPGCARRRRRGDQPRHRLHRPADGRPVRRRRRGGCLTPGGPGQIGPIALRSDGSRAELIQARPRRSARPDGRARHLPRGGRGDERHHPAGRLGRRPRPRRDRPLRLPPGQLADHLRGRRAARPAARPRRSTASPSTATPRRPASRSRSPRPPPTGCFENGSRVLLSAFGAGLTWGAGIVEWEGAA